MTTAVSCEAAKGTSLGREPQEYIATTDTKLRSSDTSWNNDVSPLRGTSGSWDGENPGADAPG